MTLSGLALMAEVVSVLARHQELPVVPEVEMDKTDDGLVSVTLTMHPRSTHEALDALALRDELQFVRDVAQMRGFAETYGIDAARLEAVLPTDDAYDGDGTTVLVLSDAEREAVELLIADGCALTGPVRMELRSVLLGVRERLLTPDQKAQRASDGDALTA